MKELSKLFEKDKWEIKTLGEIATEIYGGNGATRAQLGTGRYPAIKVGDVHGSSKSQIKECRWFVNPDLIRRKKYCEYGDVIISKLGDIGEVGKAAVYLGNERPILGQNTFLIKHRQNPKFLAYIFSSRFVRKKIKAIALRSTVVYLRKSDLLNIKIPLPPRHVQDRIAEYLDLWASPERELEGELQHKQIQYRYYKEKLFSNDEHKWDLKSLGEIANEFFCGNGVTKKQLGTGDCPAIKCGDINGRLKVHFTEKECVGFVDAKLLKNPKYFEHGDLLISRAGGAHSVGTVVSYMGNGKGIAGQSVNVLKHSQNPKFLSHMLSSRYCRQQIIKRSQKGTITHLVIRGAKRVLVPLPSLEEQERMASLLDRFLEITKSFESGIPKLMEIRRKQYEYHKEEILRPT